jgi:hypothetical protein
MIKEFTINDKKILTIVWGDYRRIVAQIKDVSLSHLVLPIRSREEVFREIESDDSNYEWIYTSD